MYYSTLARVLAREQTDTLQAVYMRVKRKDADTRDEDDRGTHHHKSAGRRSSDNHPAPRDRSPECEVSVYNARGELVRLVPDR